MISTKKRLLWNVLREVYWYAKHNFKYHIDPNIQHTHFWHQVKLPGKQKQKRSCKVLILSTTVNAILT